MSNPSVDPMRTASRGSVQVASSEGSVAAVCQRPSAPLIRIATYALSVIGLVTMPAIVGLSHADCPPFQPYSYMGNCLAECPPGTLTTVDSCTDCPPTEPYLYIGSCVAVCPPGTLTGVNTCTECETPTPYFENGACVDSCSPGTVVVDDICTECTPPAPFVENGVCVASCSPGTVVVDDICTECAPPTPFFENGVCVASCSPGTVVVDDTCTECVPPTPFVENGVCVATCLPGWVYDASEVCVECVGSTEFAENNTCVAECSPDWEADADDTCHYLGSLCPTTALVGCDEPARSYLALLDAGSDINDGIVFRSSGGSVDRTGTDFGDPVATGSVSFCIYDSSGLIAEASVPPVANWRPVGNGRGFSFKDIGQAEDGSTRVRLLAGRTGRPSPASVMVRLSGPISPDPTIPVALPITVQVVNTDNDNCFGDTFPEALVNEDRGPRRVFRSRNR